jgi:hypothetical protein
MHGTFNRVRLKRITSLKYTEPAPGITHTSFRVMEGPLRELESVLHLNAPALLILSDKRIEGTIVHFIADRHHGYEITIEYRSSK